MPFFEGLINQAASISRRDIIHTVTQWIHEARKTHNWQTLREYNALLNYLVNFKDDINTTDTTFLSALLNIFRKIPRQAQENSFR